MTKVCPKCGREKSHNLYQRNRNSKDGFSRTCRECLKLGAKKRSTLEQRIPENLPEWNS